MNRKLNWKLNMISLYILFRADMNWENNWLRIRLWKTKLQVAYLRYQNRFLTIKNELLKIELRKQENEQKTTA